MKNSNVHNSHSTSPQAGTFGEDIQLLTKHTDVVVLADETGSAQVAVVPAMQGRVMTSTAGGLDGLSYGWMNRELIASKEIQKHINAYGGEDRFWLGPEGGQFSIFFRKGAAFEMANWQTPAAIDTEPFKLVSKNKDRAEFERSFDLTNYSGTTFRLKVNREVRLLRAGELWQNLGVSQLAGVQPVAYESINRITNVGQQPWTKATGLLSIWILGMFNPSPSTTIVVPIKPGKESELGKAVIDDYFGKVPADRLVVKDKAAFFRADGQHRSKIGVTPRRCVPVMGSYDAENKVLTVVQFSFNPGTTDYVNSQWKLQAQPFAGDVANSYNDGPNELGKIMGPFYELESSSPAAALAPKHSLEHVHRTMHLQGGEADLDGVARAVFGVGVGEIKAAFNTL